jgi:hypothetical protein
MVADFLKIYLKTEYFQIENICVCVWFCLAWFALNAFMIVLKAVGGV